MSRVCEELGVVTALDSAGLAHVRVRRMEACHGCESKGVCEALGGAAKDITLVVDNALGAGVGDSVSLALLETSVIKASAAVYLIPSASLIAGAALGVAIARWIGSRDDLLSLIGAALGLVLGAAASRFVARTLAKKPELRPVMISVVERREGVGEAQEG